MSDTIALTEALIRRPSVTPDDAGCLTLISERLVPLGFELHPLPRGEVSNLWARRGSARPLFVFAGHTDVVPAGERSAWQSDPFTPTQRDGQLYGRGSADMKGSIAAMVTACERFIAAHPDHGGAIAFLLTSDEEGPAVDGTIRVVEWLQERGEQIDCCLVGEPSSSERLADVIKVGRRGSLNAVLKILGKQGHVAYPQHAENPIHRAVAALSELVAIEWDQGRDPFPPSGFQIANIHAGTGATNVIPGLLELQFNFRYSTAVTAEELKARVTELLDRHQLDYQLEWTLSGRPFLTEGGELLEAARATIQDLLGFETTLSTGGGTSDGRFIAPTGAQVIELGPLNASIHRVDEHVQLSDLEQLSQIYEGILRRLLLGAR